ncbi:MAG: hypothetical protein U0Y82_14440 [Thermoleophilia bacterium]
MSDARPRVVVTGLSIINSLGVGREDAWRAALAGTPGGAPITLFDTADSP